jgi:hypothetical protein
MAGELYLLLYFIHRILVFLCYNALQRFTELRSRRFGPRRPNFSAWLTWKFCRELAKSTKFSCFRWSARYWQTQLTVLPASLFTISRIYSPSSPTGTNSPCTLFPLFLLLVAYSRASWHVVIFLNERNLEKANARMLIKVIFTFLLLTSCEVLTKVGFFLKVHKRENFLGSDIEMCTFS